MVLMILGRITLRKIRLIAIILSLVVISGGVGYSIGQRRIGLNVSTRPLKLELVNQDQPLEKRAIDFSLFWQVWSELERSYLDQSALNTEKMVHGAISGMVASLEDPYTVFLPPDDNKQNKEDLSGKFFGVGIQLGYKDRRLAVIAPLTGMPAERAGVQSGDLIIGIKDEGKGIETETQEITLPEAVSIIRGERGTKVVLTLWREELEEPFDVEIVREEIVVPSVELELLVVSDEGETEALASEFVAHLQLKQFGEGTTEEWDSAVFEILANRDKLLGIILDMRNNPGGYLSGSVDIASEFISEGTVVVQQGRSKTETLGVKNGGRLVGIPVVVLVNGGSASASEIVAGALRDRLGVVLVGEKTFGKGSVQEARDLPGGAGLHVTTANWILPSGQEINEKGLTPEIEVEQVDDEDGVDEQLEKAKEVLIGKNSVILDIED